MAQTMKSAAASREPVEVFRAGSHRSMTGEDVTITREQLIEAAQNYDPARHEAPLVIGHPRTDAPAFGWVKALQVDGDSLLATFDQVADEFAEQVRSGRFRKISASFWTPDSPENPHPGTLALKHVGFLGAAVPAVKGMRQVQFSARGQGVLDFADPALLAMQADFDASLRGTENRRLVEGLISEGRVLPLHESGLLAFMDKLDDASVLSFSEHGQATTSGHLEWFRGFLKGLPQVVSFGAYPMGDMPRQSRELSGVTLPDGYTVSNDRLDDFARIAEHAKARNLSFAEAARLPDAK